MKESGPGAIVDQAPTQEVVRQPEKIDKMLDEYYGFHREDDAFWDRLDKTNEPPESGPEHLRLIETLAVMVGRSKTFHNVSKTVESSFPELTPEDAKRWFTKIQESDVLKREDYGEGRKYFGAKYPAFFSKNYDEGQAKLQEGYQELIDSGKDYVAEANVTVGFGRAQKTGFRVRIGGKEYDDEIFKEYAAPGFPALISHGPDELVCHLTLHREVPTDEVEERLARNITYKKAKTSTSI